MNKNFDNHLCSAYMTMSRRELPSKTLMKKHQWLWISVQVLKPTLQHQKSVDKKWYSFKEWIEVWRDVANSQTLWRIWNIWKQIYAIQNFLRSTTVSAWQMWRVLRKQSDTCFMILAVALQSIDMNIKLIVQRIGGKIRIQKRIKI